MPLFIIKVECDSIKRAVKTGHKLQMACRAAWEPQTKTLVLTPHKHADNRWTMKDAHGERNKAAGTAENIVTNAAVCF